METKRILNYEDYGVTKEGDIISYKSKIPIVLKGFINKGGYKYVDLSMNNKVTRFAIHQLVAHAYVNGFFENAVVNHKDGNKLNNCYTNLEWITQRDNIHHGYLNSGIGPMRNYLKYILISPTGEESSLLMGSQALKNYILNNNLECSFSSLLRYKKSKGYKLNTLH